MIKSTNRRFSQADDPSSLLKIAFVMHFLQVIGILLRQEPTAAVARAAHDYATRYFVLDRL